MGPHFLWMSTPWTRKFIEREPFSISGATTMWSLLDNVKDKAYGILDCFTATIVSVLTHLTQVPICSSSLLHVQVKGQNFNSWYYM